MSQFFHNVLAVFNIVNHRRNIPSVTEVREEVKEGERKDMIPPFNTSFCSEGVDWPACSRWSPQPGRKRQQSGLQMDSEKLHWSACPISDREEPCCFDHHQPCLGSMKQKTIWERAEKRHVCTCCRGGCYHHLAMLLSYFIRIYRQAGGSVTELCVLK